MPSPTTIIVWPEHVDLATIDETHATILEALSGSGITTLVVDLAGVHYLDSLGLGLLIYARNRARPLGISVVLRDLRPRTRNILRAAGLDPLFDYQSTDAADHPDEP